jgi:hypothetical protein
MMKCQQCGREFQATRPEATYCSGACRVAAHRVRKKPRVTPVTDSVGIALLKAEIAQLHEENARLKAEIASRPAQITIEELRRMDAVGLHTQRITTDIETYGLFRRCLHPDSRHNASDQMLHKAWIAFQNLEAITWDKKTAPKPLPQTVDDWLRKGDEAKARRKKQ